MTNLSNNLKIKREVLGLTKDEVAKQLDVYSMDISKWENGEAEPTNEQLEKLAILFKVSAEDLKNKDFSVENGKLVSMKAKRDKASIVRSILVGSVWLICLISFFVASYAFNAPRAWLAFIYALPLSCLVSVIQLLIVYKTFKNGILLGYISGFVWTICLALYLQFMFVPFTWVILIAAIPLQAVVVGLAKLK